MRRWHRRYHRRRWRGYFTSSNASGSSCCGLRMRIDFLPASRSSSRLPTSSARQPRSSSGVSSLAAAEAEAVGDQVAHVGGRADHAGGDLGAAADRRERRREELPQQIELRRRLALRRAAATAPAAPRGRAATHAASSPTLRFRSFRCMPRMARI